MDKCNAHEISVEELHRVLISKDDSYFILDVRQPWECNLVSIAHAVNIPVSQLEEELDLIPRDKKIRVICHHGVRSLWACSILEKNGITDVKSVRGGVDLYAQICDTSLKRY